MQIESFSKFVGGFILMITGITLGIIMPWVGGMTLDQFYDGLVPQDLQAAAAGPTYDAMAAVPQIPYYTNLYYALCAFLGILGIVLFYQSLVRDESADAPQVRYRGRY